MIQCGSLAHGLLAVAWSRLAEEGFDPAAYDDLVVRRLVEPISTRSLMGVLLKNAWRLLGRKNRTDLLALNASIESVRNETDPSPRQKLAPPL